MANYLVTDTELTSVANAIRTKGGTESLLEFPSEFVSAISAIPTGGSSDFSTATVTIINTATSDPSVFSAFVDQTKAIAYDSGSFNIDTYAVTSLEPVTFVFHVEFPITLDTVDAGTTPTCTGACVLAYDELEEAYVATVSGNCTISVVKNGGN